MPETVIPPQNCAEGLSGGADNGCYGKLKLISPHVNKFVVLCLG